MSLCDYESFLALFLGVVTDTDLSHQRLVCQAVVDGHADCQQDAL
jgi:hypothetical protein